MSIYDWKATMISYLLPVNGAEVDLELAVEIKDSKIPNSLYRFRAVPDHQSEPTRFNRLLREILNHEVWLTPALNYNDPFDTAVTFSYQQIFARIPRSHLLNTTREFPFADLSHIDLDLDRIYNSPKPWDTWVDAVLDAIDKNSIRNLKELFESSYKTLQRKHVINFSSSIQMNTHACSFTENSKSIVMWSHYAGSHSGICVEYPLDRGNAEGTLRSLIYPVVYQEKLFDITTHIAEYKNTSANAQIIGLLASIHKSSQWSYEREWRIVDFSNRKPTGSYFKMPKPSRLFLGARITEFNETQLREVAGTAGIPVERMKISADAYELESEIAEERNLRKRDS